MECGAKEESEEKIKRKRGLSPLSHPLVVVFLCSHLFPLSPAAPRSERLEQVMLVCT